MSSSKKRKKKTPSTSQTSSQSSTSSTPTTATPTHGELILISELPSVCDGSWDGRSVRITGHLAARNTRESTVDVSYKGSTITISTRLIETPTDKDGNNDPQPFVYKKGALWQFIGEIQETSSADRYERILIARVASFADGMNMTLFERALVAQREFLQNLLTENESGAGAAKRSKKN